MSLGLLVGEDEYVANWSNTFFNVFPIKYDRVIGVIDEERSLVGAIFFHNFNGVNVELGYYGPKTLSLGIVRSICRIVISEFKASRLTVVTSRRKKHLIKSLIKIGFRIEGVQRRFYGDRDCHRNTATRLVAFHEDVCRVGGIKPILQG
jgi:hypothetical protein